MKIEFFWYDKQGHNPNFRVWKPWPRFKKYWSGEILNFTFWKWGVNFDFRDGGFWGYIKRTIWENRLKDRQN